MEMELFESCFSVDLELLFNIKLPEAGASGYKTPELPDTTSYEKKIIYSADFPRDSRFSYC